MPIVAFQVSRTIILSTAVAKLKRSPCRRSSYLKLVCCDSFTFSRVHLYRRKHWLEFSVVHVGYGIILTKVKNFTDRRQHVPSMLHTFCSYRLYVEMILIKNTQNKNASVRKFRCEEVWIYYFKFLPVWNKFRFSKSVKSCYLPAMHLYYFIIKHIKGEHVDLLAVWRWIFRTCLKSVFPISNARHQIWL